MGSIKIYSAPMSFIGSEHYIHRFLSKFSVTLLYFIGLRVNWWKNTFFVLTVLYHCLKMMPIKIQLELKVKHYAYLLFSLDQKQ